MEPGSIIMKSQTKFPEGNCAVVMTEPYEKNTMSIGVQNNSAYKSYNFNNFVVTRAEFGITQRELEKLTPPLNCVRDTVEIEQKPVLFELVIPVFYVLFGLMFLSVTVFLYEIIFFKTKLWYNK